MTDTFDTHEIDIEQQIEPAPASARADPRDLWFDEWELTLPQEAREAWPGSTGEVERG